jgi:hypothetical protein
MRLGPTEWEINKGWDIPDDTRDMRDGGRDREKDNLKLKLKWK